MMSEAGSELLKASTPDKPEKAKRPGLAKCGSIKDIYQISPFIESADTSALIIRDPSEVYVHNIRRAHAMRMFKAIDYDKIAEIQVKMGDAICNHILETYNLVQESISFLELCRLAEKLHASKGRKALIILRSFAEDIPDIFAASSDDIYDEITSDIADAN
jgi:hypothetical protein